MNKEEIYITNTEKIISKRKDISIKELRAAEKILFDLEAKMLVKFGVNLGEVDTYNENLALIKKFWKLMRRKNYSFGA